MDITYIPSRLVHLSGTPVVVYVRETAYRARRARRALIYMASYVGRHSTRIIDDIV